MRREGRREGGRQRGRERERERKTERERERERASERAGTNETDIDGWRQTETDTPTDKLNRQTGRQTLKYSGT